MKNYQIRDLHIKTARATGKVSTHAPFKVSNLIFIRSTAELDGGEGACRAVWIGQQLLHRDSDRHHSDWIRVCLIKHSPQTLDGFSLCKRSI